MTRVLGGILLPESVLTSQWFIVFATVVAFNTIVYVGLTLAKLIPLPKQIHPSRVRGWLERVGAEMDESAAENDIPIGELAETQDAHENMRRSIARREIPQAFALAGGLIVVLSLVGFLTSGDDRVFGSLAELAAGLGFFALSQIVGRAKIRTPAIRWLWAMACVVLVEILIIQATRQGNQVALTYALLVMVAFAPVVLAWAPALCAGAVMLFTISAASVTIAGTDDLRIITTSGAALLVSALLLRLRLSSIDALGDEQARSQALTTTDVLTGVLTHNGLLSAMPTVAGLAARTDENVCVMWIRIQDLSTANRQYGRQYGDDLLKSVAEALLARTRQGDVIARWSGTQFLVVGLGGRPDAIGLAHRMHEWMSVERVNLGRPPVVLEIGTSSGDPCETTMDVLVDQARTDAVVGPGHMAGESV